jgi:hypothetical protein
MLIGLNSVSYSQEILYNVSIYSGSIFIRNVSILKTVPHDTNIRNTTTFFKGRIPGTLCGTPVNMVCCLHFHMCVCACVCAFVRVCVCVCVWGEIYILHVKFMGVLC